MQENIIFPQLVKKDESWIISSAARADQMIRNISDTYTNFAVSDFNSGRSVL